MEVTDAPVSLGRGPFVVQNLGPDTVYLGEAEVSDETGFSLGVNDSASFGYLNYALHAVTAEADTASVRVLYGATSLSYHVPSED